MGAPPQPITTIISPQYCLPYPVDLAFTKKTLPFTDYDFLITDVNDKDTIIFKVKHKLFSPSLKQTLFDGVGIPLVTVTKKLWSQHCTHFVYRGESTEENNLFCTVKESKKFLSKETTLDVFLASNTTMDVPNFRVKGSRYEQSCVVYAGKSENVVAQRMNEKRTIQSMFSTKEKFIVTVYPDIDQAFIISIIIVLNKINCLEEAQSSNAARRNAARRNAARR